MKHKLSALLLAWLSLSALSARAEVALAEVAHWGAGPGDAVGTALNIEVSGHYAYIADGERGLQILDVGNPAQPVLVGGLDTGGWARGLAVADGRAYLTDFYNGFLVVDVSDPSAPALLGSAPVYGEHIALTGHYAYVAGHGLWIIDVSDPSAPELVWKLNDSEWEIYDWQVYDIAISGDYAYMLATPHSEAFVLLGGLWIADISDPVAPKPVGHTDDGGTSVTVSGAYVYLGGANGLTIIDAGNPALPALVGRLSLVGWNIAVSGGSPYVSTSGNGLWAVDITDPAAPKLAGGFSAPEWTSESLAVSDGYIYAANGRDQVRIFSVTPADTQCAVYDPAAAPQLNIPCVQVNGAVYRAALEQLPGAGPRFAVDWAHSAPANLSPGPDCAVFPHGASETLRLNCLQADGGKYWAEMGFAPDTPDAVFELRDYGAR